MLKQATTPVTEKLASQSPLSNSHGTHKRAEAPIKFGENF